MSGRGKGTSGSIQKKKRTYISWNSQMEDVLVDVLGEQARQGNRGDNDWKPQAYQAVVDEVRNKLGMSITTEHVSNHIRTWKRHYAVISDIRNKSKFKWDDERKMISIPIEDLEDWRKYCKDNPNSAYKNKTIDQWSNICMLVGDTRALVIELRIMKKERM